jgi:NhaP-type Na+/H+ or K+/H+ antiporter
MYEGLAVLALLIFLFSVVAGRIEHSYISGPIVFVVSGFVMGPMVLGWFEGDVTNTEFRVIADLTLALILFIDAAHADLSILKRQIRIPSRMLLIGLPGVIALGFGLAVLMFDQLSLYEAAILATILAATDAALGKAVITNKAVPVQVREGLNAESGLNDGLCVPVLLVFIALAKGAGADGGGAGLAFKLVAQELGIGLIVGLGLTALGGWLMRICWKRGWITKIWMHVSVVSLALSAFAIAQSLHGSGYIAAFTGGMLFGFLAKEDTHEMLLAAEVDGEILAMIAWFAFGVAVIGQQSELFTWQVVGYAVLSLTVIRVLPIFLSLTGSGESVSSRLFLGWFGPRGLASIVFGVIVLNADLPGGRFIAIVVVCTVFLSLVAHGLSANPLAKWLAMKENSGKTEG